MSRTADVTPPKIHYNDGTEPSANDDLTKGYEIGSQWHYQPHPATNIVFICYDDSITSASWGAIELV